MLSCGKVSFIGLIKFCSVIFSSKIIPALSAAGNQNNNQNKTSCSRTRTFEMTEKVTRRVPIPSIQVDQASEIETEDNEEDAAEETRKNLRLLYVNRRLSTNDERC